MKKICFTIACLGLCALVACNGSKNESSEGNPQMVELNDSLQTVLAEKDSLLAFMTEISEGMLQIRDMEKILSTGNLTNETADKKAEVRDNMVAIQQALEARRKKLEALEARLKKSSAYSASLEKTIDSLKAQIESQETEIAGLQVELRNANIQIEGLNGRVDSLSRLSAAERSEKELAQNEATRLANELNACYYAIGSKKELKENKIIEGGFLRKTKIMESDYEKSYFTKADKRSLQTIPLRSKKAKVLSKHPAGSYTIDADAEGMKTLKISDGTRFWEMSNFLIVQID